MAINTNPIGLSNTLGLRIDSFVPPPHPARIQIGTSGGDLWASLQEDILEEDDEPFGGQDDTPEGGNTSSGSRLPDLLVALGCVDSRWVDEQGRTLLMYAVEEDDLDAALFVLSNNPDSANARDSAGLTALMYAARAGSTDMLELLAGHPDVNIDLADHMGQTALMHAVRSGAECVVSLVLAGNPSIDYETPEGESALTIANDLGLTHISKLLEDALARENTKKP